jgi:predicted lipoprotein with Yx(FWY)xxD motif
MVGGGIRGSGGRGIQKQELPADWHPALLYPRSDMQLPLNVGVKEVLAAAALALVDHRGHTLYYSDRNERDTLTEERKSEYSWVPVPAPQLADVVGDFTFTQRKDGIRQWVYKGKALYSYTGDLAPGDAAGDGVAGWHVAAIARQFMPESVLIGQTPGLGKMLTTADGMALYKRDGYIHQSGGGYSLRRGAPTRPAVGRDIGTDARCNAECMKVWHPFVAPNDAHPQGYWDVATRDDGTKQWIYQGFALWRYDGDKVPGDINGNDQYDMELSHDPMMKISLGTPMDAAAALYWGIMSP